MHGTPKTHTELVGLVVGKIMSNSMPLVFNLYITPNGVGHVRIEERTDTSSSPEVVAKLLQVYQATVVGVWRNEFLPPWWFIGTYDGASPDLLYQWTLPWSTIALWRKWLKGATR